MKPVHRWIRKLISLKTMRHSIESWSMVLKSPSETEQKVLGSNWNYVEDEFLFKFHTHVKSVRGLNPKREVY